MKTLFCITIFSCLLINNSYSQDVRSYLKDRTFSESDFLVPNDSCAVNNPERHDDFTHENGYLLSSDSTRFVLKMTPQSYPWIYSKVCVAWTRLNGASGNINYDIVVYDTTGPGGVPGNLIAFVPNQSLSGITIFPQAVWNSTPVALPQLNNGSYYIGVRWKNSANPNTFVSGDESGTTGLWPGFLSGTTAGTPVWNFVQSNYPAYKCLCIRTEGGPPPSLPPFSCGTMSYFSITGTNGPTGDDATMNIPLPFTFSYSGGNFTSVSICTNGWVVLGVSTSTEYNNNLCNTTAGLLNLLAPYWDDLNPAAGQIVYNTFGSAPNRVFIVQFSNVPFFSGTGNVTFQVRLFETYNVIDFAYGPGTNNPAGTGHIGINKPTGGTGNITNIIPGSNCGNTQTSNSSCTNVPYNLASGTLYRFGTGIPVGINNGNGIIPAQYTLSQNYPNPFNPATKISYDLPKSGNVQLKIYDVLGREVKTLINEFKPAGSYDVTFDGSELASGLYFYTIKSGEFTETKKMLMIK